MCRIFYRGASCFYSYLVILSLVDTREVIDLKVNNKSTEWIALSWESPCDDATDPMSNVSIIYRIEICDGENCNQTNETVTWHNATDLDPCTSYTFTVKILTDYWESDGVTLSETTDHNSRFTIAYCMSNIHNILSKLKIKLKKSINILVILISSSFQFPKSEMCFI